MPDDAIAIAGKRSHPYLADHGFHDLVVLPGAFYLVEAVRLYRERCRCGPTHLREVRFLTPAILSDEELRFDAALREPAPGRLHCDFSSGGSVFATLEMDAEALLEASPESQQMRGGPLASKDFYARLQQNGNQYGPGFQLLSEIRRDGRRAAASIFNSKFHPAVLDACTQLLSAPILELGRAFALQSIGELRLYELNLPETLRVESELDAGDGAEGFAGEIRVFGGDGKLCLHFMDVRFAFLDAPREQTRAPLHICIASTFTAEPIADSLKFWSAHLNLPIEVGFAPYNQVFQELLDPASTLRRNRGGVNAILLNLEDWTRRQRALPLDRERAARNFGGQPRHTLPNGMEIVHLNRHETEYVFQEIFEDQSYLKHNIQLNDGDTVLDIGANIGLFSLFVASACKRPKIYAFEPSPAAFERLKANGETYIADFHAFHCGVSDRRKTGRFTFYETSSVFSSFHSDEAEDRAAIQAVVRNMLGEDSTEQDVEALTADRLRHSIHEIPLLSVSDIIREQCLDAIDLLKIDAEKSEWDILSGINDEHWPIIKQIVIELHDPTGAAARRAAGLLRERGFHCAVEQEKLLEHSGLFNLYATRDTNSPKDALARNLDEFCAAVGSFGEPLYLCVTPRKSSALDETETALAERLSPMRHVRWLGSKQILELYPVQKLHDEHSRHLGHIPYTADGFAAIGTALFRSMFSAMSRPYKVIALDCDNTLWRGECGEDGPHGIEISPAHRALHEFLLQQMRAGLLLCLCSRNNEEDVFAVFDQRSDLPLRREHLAAWKINWDRKSDNLHALADELGLGLDGFVFLDDNPVECADVKAACPGVLTLSLPRNDDEIAPFLRHVWAFDHTTLTEEDKHRTVFHQENLRREKLREQSLSLRNFIDGLELSVQIEPPREGQFARVSQLTFRTNQFNLTTIRRSEEELAAALQDGLHCLTATVADRFGDYGMVGVILYRPEAATYVVDTFLLSCRALGRGVEHRMLAALGERALAAGIETIRLTCQPTGKNLPAVQFVESLGNPELPAHLAASLRYDPEAARREGAGIGVPSSPRTAFSPDLLQQIAVELRDVSQISAGIARGKQIVEPLAARVAPRNRLETALAEVWKRVLGRTQLGTNENFFEAGGTSLTAVLVVAEIRRELKKDLSIVTLFECPTIQLLAAHLEAPSGEERVSAAETRGQQRRARAVHRRVRA